MGSKPPQPYAYCETPMCMEQQEVGKICRRCRDAQRWRAWKKFWAEAEDEQWERAAQSVAPFQFDEFADQLIEEQE